MESLPFPNGPGKLEWDLKCVMQKGAEQSLIIFCNWNDIVIIDDLEEAFGRNMVSIICVICMAYWESDIIFNAVETSCNKVAIASNSACWTEVRVDCQIFDVGPVQLALRVLFASVK